MKLQDQVCTLEQAKALVKLGLKQLGSYFSYLGNVDYEPDLKSDDGNNYPAFTSAELGVMLPSESGIIGWEVYYNDHLGCWNCVIRDLVKWKGGKTIPPVAYDAEGDSMAEAMAAALIHCIENKLATPEEINNRLND